MSASLLNSGTFVAQGSTSITGALTTAPGAMLRVLGSNAGSSATLTISSGFTNTGALQLTTIDGGYSVQLNVGGTLTNASTGTITSLQGASGSRVLSAQLNNQGAVLVPYDLTLTRASAAHVNSGTITMSGVADLTVTQSGTSPSFTNTGTITLAPARSLAVSNGLLDLSAGVVAGYTSYLTTTGTPTVRFTTATVQGRIGLATGALVPDPFVIPAGDSLRLYTGTFAPPSLTNNGSLLLEGTAVLTTALTTGAGSLLRVRGNNVTSSVNATITNAFTNTAALELIALDGGYSVQLNVGGTLTNASTGTIEFQVGSNGSRTFSVPLLDNLGTVTASSSASISGSVNQRNVLSVLATRALAISGALALFNGSVTTATGGTLTRGSCSISGSPTFSGFACP